VVGDEEDEPADGVCASRAVVENFIPCFVAELILVLDECVEEVVEGIEGELMSGYEVSPCGDVGRKGLV